MGCSLAWRRGRSSDRSAPLSLLVRCSRRLPLSRSVVRLLRLRSFALKSVLVAGMIVCESRLARRVHTLEESSRNYPRHHTPPAQAARRATPAPPRSSLGREAPRGCFIDGGASRHTGPGGHAREFGHSSHVGRDVGCWARALGCRQGAAEGPWPRGPTYLRPGSKSVRLSSAPRPSRAGPRRGPLRSRPLPLPPRALAPRLSAPSPLPPSSVFAVFF